MDAVNDNFTRYFAEVREASGPKVWSKAVSIARGDAVRLVATPAMLGNDAFAYLVKEDGLAVSRRVEIFPGDGDWSCDCLGVDNPCAHVAAAVITHKKSPPSPDLVLAASTVDAAGGRLSYVFSKKSGYLELQRWVHGLGAAPILLEKSLLAIASGRVQGPKILAEASDLEIDRLLTQTSALPQLTVANVAAVLSVLASYDDLLLAGAPVRTSKQAFALVVEFKDQGPGVVAKGYADPWLKETFANGCGLLLEPGKEHPTLVPVKLPALSPEDQQLVRAGRYFAPRDLAELQSSILPRLKEREGLGLRVLLHSRGLRPTIRVAPRIKIDSLGRGQQLSLHPYVVYGDPPLAVVHGGELRCLSSNAGDAVPIRDLDAERRLKDQLWQEFKLELDRPLVMDKDLAIAKVQELEAAAGARTPAAFKFELHGNGQEHFAVRPPLEPTLQGGPGEGLGGDLQVVFSCAFGMGPGGPRRWHAAPEAVLSAYQKGESLVPLLEGGFAPVPTAWLQQHGERVRDLLTAQQIAAESGASHLPKACVPALAAWAEELGVALPDTWRELKERLGSQELEAAVLPVALEGVLRDYQKAGVAWLAHLRQLGMGGLLADDMGLGKTIQAIAVLSKPSLVVAPTSVARNWLAELERFRPELKVHYYYGPERHWDTTADVVVTTYALLRLDHEIILGQKFAVCVLDETQIIKNPASQAARTAHKIKADTRIALSGTPVENQLGDLWSQMHFANPGLLGTRADFEERYARKIAAGEPAPREALRQRLRPFLLRRLKKDVLAELPPRSELILRVEMSADEMALYQSVHALARADVVRRLDEGAQPFTILQALLRLRQAACHPALLEGSPPGLASSKLQVLLERLQVASSEGHRSLVFSQWTSLLDLLEPMLKAAGIRFGRIDGATKDRQDVVRDFQAEGGPEVMLLSLKAGGVGLNLTAADHVFMLDPWWNPAVEEQAKDRAHRIGQTRPVLVQRLVSVGTIEERILALQEQKRLLADWATYGIGAAPLTREELLALLD